MTGPLEQVDPDDQSARLILLKPFKAADDDVVLGAVRHRADCGHLCWISPVSLAYMRTHPNALTGCLHCHPPEEQQTPPQLLAGTLAELAMHYQSGHRGQWKMKGWKQ